MPLAVVISLTLCTLGLLSACQGSSGPNDGGTGNGGTGTGNSGPVPLTATATLQIDAGTSGEFGPLALTAAGAEGELFFSQSDDAGSIYVLQHLSTAGAAAGASVEVASGTPFGIPKVAISSDGKEIACCWDDWGRLNPASPTAGSVTRCNSVPVGGSATDKAMDGGFGDLGSRPSLAQGGSTTALVYVQESDPWVSETILYYGSRIQATFIAPYNVAQVEIAPLGFGFTLFMSDGGVADLSAQGNRLENDGGLQAVPGGISTGSFAVATSAIPALPATTAVVLHQGSKVMVTLLGATNTSGIDLGLAGEQPLDAVAAVGCNPGTFGFAYALDGGDLALRELSAKGTISGSATIAAPLGGDVSSVALAAVDGGMLIAAGNAGAIAIYSAPCP